jgi:TetR/AcrR family transcriptional regulator
MKYICQDASVTNRPETARNRATRGRPSGTDNTDLRARLINAALELIAEQPWERVSARAVAQRAECDPALVNYYFGSRSGLIVAVAEHAAQRLGGRLELAYSDEGTIEERIKSAVEDPIRVLADDPQLAQLFLDELVIHGDENSDPALHELARPYLDRLQHLVDEGIASGELRNVDRQLLVYALGALPLLFRITAPLFQRSFGELGLNRQPAAFSAALADILLNGALRQPPP